MIYARFNSHELQTNPRFICYRQLDPPGYSALRVARRWGWTELRSLPLWWQSSVRGTSKPCALRCICAVFHAKTRPLTLFIRLALIPTHLFPANTLRVCSGVCDAGCIRLPGAHHRCVLYFFFGYDTFWTDILRILCSGGRGPGYNVLSDWDQNKSRAAHHC